MRGGVDFGGLRGGRRRLTIAALVVGAVSCGAPPVSQAQMGPGYCIGFMCEGPENAEYSLTFERQRDGDRDEAVAAGVGDLDGDGAEEIAVTLMPPLAPTAERTLLVLNGRATGSQPGAATEMRIVDDGTEPFGQALGIADVNGDGTREIAVGTGTGIAVVYGRTDGATVDLRDLGADGFRVTDSALDSDEKRLAFALRPRFVAPDDLDGDGRGDLAFVDGSTVRFFFPPADTAGRTFDAASPDGRFTTFATAASYYEDLQLAEGGDLDGDGTLDPVVFVNHASGSDAIGLTRVGPGESLDIAVVAESGDGFELHSQMGGLGRVMGDFNRDGRLDLRLPGIDGAILAYSPAPGTERSFGEEIAAGTGMRATLSGIWNVGDIDGDGIDDMGGDGALSVSGGVVDPADPSGAGWEFVQGRTWLYRETTVDMLADATGDGLPEELTSSYRWSSQTNVIGARIIRTFHSRPFIPIDVLPAVRRGTNFELRSGVDPTPANISRLNGAIFPSVSFYRDGRLQAWMQTGNWSRDTGQVTGMTAPASFIGYVEGGSEVTFRVELERDNRPLARGALQSLDDAEVAPEEAGGGGGAGSGTGAAPNRIRGSRKGDRLVGTDGADVIDAGRGRDKVKGMSGDDVLDGGPGRDVLRCGPGDDVAIVEGRDRLIGCEGRARIFG